MKKILSKRMSSENKEKFISRMRREIKACLMTANEAQIEEAMSAFSDVAGPKQIFNLSLVIVNKFKSCGIHYIARSSTDDAVVWLKKRINEVVVQEAVEIWLLDYRVRGVSWRG